MKTFLISDLHLGHNNVYRFTGDDGQRIRPWADDAEEGDQIMMDNWNKVVGAHDKVYVLGDVAIARKAIHKLGGFNGRKVLIKGNHDIFKAHDYLPYFDDLRGSHKLNEFILTHIPIHPESLARWTTGNIHGHLHQRRVMLDAIHPDTRYINVSVERVGATPIDFQEIADGVFALQDYLK